jgi:hypothetical protein
MAHTTAIPAVSQSTKAHSDWFTLLGSAFINGLKAYGASLMVAAPLSTAQSQSLVTSPKPAPRRAPAVATEAAPALSHAPLANPAWSRV